MELSKYVIFGVIELYVVLLGITIFLVFHARTLKGVVKKLQDRLKKAVDDLKKSKAAYQKAQDELNVDPAETQLRILDEQLDITRDYHATLDPDQDIALDLNTAVPLPRQVAAFRHALLIAEKEALYASGTTIPNWGVLENKLSQLIGYYQDPHNDDSTNNTDTDNAGLSQLQEELDNSKKRVSNLERFKTLFFDMEEQWNQAKAEAEDYYHQLMSMADSMENSDNFENLLERYNQVYNAVGETIVEATGDAITTVKMDPKSQQELANLRNVATEQQRLIKELQKKLSNAETADDKALLINELNHQLERQQRFVKESETCITLLEGELTEATNVIRAMEAKLKQDGNKEENQKLKALVRQFSTESKEMLQNLAQLEMEKEGLEKELQQDSKHASSAKVESLQQELLQLQAQYADLEERYLDLKLQQ